MFNPPWWSWMWKSTHGRPLRSESMKCVVAPMWSLVRKFFLMRLFAMFVSVTLNVGPPLLELAATEGTTPSLETTISRRFSNNITTVAEHHATWEVLLLQNVLVYNFVGKLTNRRLHAQAANPTIGELSQLIWFQSSYQYPPGPPPAWQPQAWPMTWHVATGRQR